MKALRDLRRALARLSPRSRLSVAEDKRRRERQLRDLGHSRAQARKILAEGDDGAR